MKYLKYFKSRTVWVIIILFVINGFEGVRELLPGFWLPVVDGVLSMLAVYFRINRKFDK
jgi:hypothetical protein